MPNATGDDEYFLSYSSTSIHKEMIQDRVRTDAYLYGIKCNRDFFEGKVVLDVGCGSGILSLFAATNGARKVYAIEASPIADVARRIVKENGLDGIIEVIRGKVEDILLPEPVDTIISEWMGYFLFFESMLLSVISARDRFLRSSPDSIVLPHKCRLYIAGIVDPENRDGLIDFWTSVHGFDLSAMRELALSEGVVDIITYEHLGTTAAVIASMDLMTVTEEDAKVIQSDFELVAEKDFTMDGFGTWFDVTFPKAPTVGREVILSTSPSTEGRTHWAQTLFYVEKPEMVRRSDRIFGHIHVRPNGINHRKLDLTIQWRIGATGYQHSQEFTLR